MRVPRARSRAFPAKRPATGDRHARPARGRLERRLALERRLVRRRRPPVVSSHPLMRRGETFSTDIDRLAFGGRGVGHAPDGRVAFVDGGLPGDRVEAALTRIKPSFVEAKVVQVLAASPYRIEARCPHHGVCGGCRLQTLEYSVQVAQKAAQVAEALEHIGGLAGTRLLPALPADEPWFYRNKMEFTFGVERRRDDDEDGGGGGGAGYPDTGAPTLVLGLHRRGRFDRIVDLEACYLLDERTGRLLDATRAWARRNRLAPYDPRRGEGLLRHLVVRLGKATGESMVDLVTTSPDPPAPDDLVDSVTRVLPDATVVHTTHRGRATAYMVETQTVLAGRGVVRERLGELAFDISPASFFQTNSLMAARLLDVVAEAACLRAGDRVLDLYCGTGAIGIALARHCDRVIGLEANEAAVADADRNAALNDLGNVSFVLAKAEEALEDVLGRLGPFEVAVVDPPRAGLHPKALRALAASAVDRVAYVSCNASTLARDVTTLAEAGLHLDWVRPLDLFPHTPHVEAVAALSRSQAGRLREPA